MGAVVPGPPPAPALYSLSGLRPEPSPDLDGRTVVGGGGRQGARPPAPECWSQGLGRARLWVSVLGSVLPPKRAGGGRSAARWCGARQQGAHSPGEPTLALLERWRKCPGVCHARVPNLKTAGLPGPAGRAPTSPGWVG